MRTITLLTLVASIAGARTGSAQIPAGGTQPSAVAAPAARVAPVAGAVSPPSDYIIGAEDLLSVVFWRDKDMSSDVAVRPDGKISLPLLNDVQAAGLTTTQLRDRLTESGLRVGTPAYMSPEQATGDGQPDARSDVYSLAAVLYEMLAGEPPHTGPTAQAIIAKLLTEPPMRLAVVRDDVPAVIDAALARALAKLPAERFSRAADFAAALAGAPGRGAVRGRSRGLRVLTASVIVATVLAAGWGWLHSRSAHRPLVIMMDSPNPARIYDEETIRASGTNADVISDILADLPIVRQKESGGPGWHRYDELVSFNPDLIVMHYSTFRGSNADDPRPGLKTFLRYFADRPTRFLIYTRSSEAEVRHAVDSLMADVNAQHPGLLARITVFGTPDHGGGPHWRDPVTAGELKLAVKRILALQ